MVNRPSWLASWVVWSANTSRVTTLAPYSQSGLSIEIKEFRADREQRLVYKLFGQGRAGMTGSTLVARGSHAADQPSTEQVLTRPSRSLISGEKTTSERRTFVSTRIGKDALAGRTGGL